MKKLVYNNENLSEQEIDEVVTRVKVFLVNENNELLIATSGGGCQLPGGHREEGEDLMDTVVREMREETGINLEKYEIKDSFFSIQHLTRNYKNSGKNRCSEMIYFHVVTSKEPNLDNLNLTEDEKKNEFAIEKVKIDNIEEYIKSFINETQKETNIIIAKEILVAVKEFKAYLNNYNEN